MTQISAEEQHGEDDRRDHDRDLDNRVKRARPYPSRPKPLLKSGLGRTARSRLGMIRTVHGQLR